MLCYHENPTLTSTLIHLTFPFSWVRSKMRLPELPGASSIVSRPPGLDSVIWPFFSSSIVCVFRAHSLHFASSSHASCFGLSFVLGALYAVFGPGFAVQDKSGSLDQ
jgi:hypothetical protein